MTTVHCYSTECAHNRQFECQASDISVMHDEWCKEYEDYTKGFDYQYVYYRAIGASEKRLPVNFRWKWKGKKYEFGGLTFYTSADDREGIKYLDFTEERTGYRFPGTCFDDPAAFEKVCAELPAIPDVMDLPEGECVNGKWRLVQP